MAAVNAHGLSILLSQFILVRPHRSCCPIILILEFLEHVDSILDLFLTHFDEVLRHMFVIKFIQFHNEISIYVHQPYLYCPEVAAGLL